MFSSRFAASTTLVFAILATSLSHAQVASRLSGSVQDPTGAAVPAATVDVYLPGGAKPIISGATTAEGLFNFVSIPSGTYDVVVTATGFRKHTERGVILTAANETSMAAIKLEVGSVAEVVEVTGTALTVQTTNSEVSSTITRQQIRDLPVLNRSPLGFVSTQAGANISRGGVTIINGQRTTFTNVTLDGINVQDNYIRTNAVDFLPNLLLLDQVAEVTLSTSNSNPAAGNGASQVTFVTPSGGNQWHGGAFIQNRNSAFAASSWFNNQSGTPKAFLNLNQLGGNLNGPIKKDKLFFYANYEAFRQHQQTTQTRPILTDTARQGIFSYLAGGQMQRVNVLTLAGESIDPTMKALMDKQPAASAINSTNAGDSASLTQLRNTGGYTYNLRNNRIRNNVTGRLDYNMSTKNSFAVTFAWNSDLLDRPDLSTDYKVVPPVSNDNVTKLLSTAWRSTPTATITNEVRFGFNLAPGLFLTNEQFPNALYATTTNISAAGGGLIYANPVNLFRAQGRYTNTYNFADNAAWLKGKHNLTFGYQLQRNYTSPYNDAGITPTYTLGMSPANTKTLSASQIPGASANDVTAANNLLANLAGYITSYTQTFNVTSRNSGFVNGATNARNWNFDNHALYVQDNFRVLPRLTINLGVRYEYQTVVKERDGLALLPVVSGSAIDTLRNPASTLDFASGGSRPLYNADKNNFGPNIGIAWDITGDGKTALRAGYSVNFVNDEFLVAITGNANTNAGLSQARTGQGLVARSSALPAIAPPDFKVPRTFGDNYALSRTTNFGISDPNLRSPYVQQWTIGIQREVKGVVLDARYVANHGTKLLRALDYNQININAGGFLADFQRAQNNGLAAQRAGGAFNPAYNPAIAGSQQLTVLTTLPSQCSPTSAANVTTIQQGSAADYAWNCQSTVNPPFSFFANPNAASLRMLTNYSNSTYNSLQLEARTRQKRGLTLQVNYVYSKVLSDAVSGNDNNNQGRYEPMLDNANPQLERARAPFDLTHVFKFNYVYLFPIGKGHRFGWQPINKALLDGWMMSGIFQRQSGQPFSIYSGRGTFNRQSNMQTQQGNTMNSALTMDELRDVMSYRMSGTGPYMVAASALGSDGRAVAPDGAAAFSGQAFTMPGPGTIGTLGRRIFDGPWNTTFNFGLLKRTQITERNTLDIRMDVTNFFNHPTFTIGDQTATSTTFGKITSTFTGARVFQFSMQYRF